MKHTFQATDAHATHVRTSDGVEGILHAHSDASVVLPLSALVDLADFAAIPEPPAPVVIPSEIANWRAKAILGTMGLTANVEAIIASLPEPQRTVVTAAWAGGAPFVRNGPTVTALGTALGMSAGEIDALFIAAEAIEI